MSASLAIEIHAGSSIDSASADAQRIADLLGITCVFEFNDVRCIALPGGDASLLAERQQEEQSRKLTAPYDYRRANSKATLTAAGGAPTPPAITARLEPTSVRMTGQKGSA